VVGAGLLPEWVLAEAGVSIRRLPTHYGTLNYSVRPGGKAELVVAMSGDINLPPGRIVLPSPLEQPLLGVTVNGREIASFTQDEAVIDQFPATVVLRYSQLPSSAARDGLQETDLGLEDQAPGTARDRDS
jgi:hypothetical protein